MILIRHPSAIFDEVSKPLQYRHTKHCEFWRTQDFGVWIRAKYSWIKMSCAHSAQPSLRRAHRPWALLVLLLVQTLLVAVEARGARMKRPNTDGEPAPGNVVARNDDAHYDAQPRAAAATTAAAAASSCDRFWCAASSTCVGHWSECSAGWIELAATAAAREPRSWVVWIGSFTATLAVATLVFTVLRPKIFPGAASVPEKLPEQPMGEAD